MSRACGTLAEYAMTHFAEQKIGRQVILSSGTSTPKGAYANGM